MTVRIAVKVVPGASRDEIAGWLGDELKIRVVAAPERGQANRGVERVLAEALGVSARDVRVIRGASSSRKLVEIAGLSAEEARHRLPQRHG